MRYSQDPPRLSWLNGKTAPQANGGRKNTPGRKQEFEKAVAYQGGLEKNESLELPSDQPA